jgi:hypothetical protein
MFWKKCLAKIASPTAHEEESWDNYYFQLHPNSCLCERRRKTTSPVKLFGK